MRKVAWLLSLFICVSLIGLRSPADAALREGPSVAVFYDGPDEASNPARLDALYLGNLLGHFTTRRTITPLERYRREEFKRFDAVFVIIYRKNYKVPAEFLADAPLIERPFCWVGNQPAQLGLYLTRHGLSAGRLWQDSPFVFVRYKGRRIPKGDPDINVLNMTGSRAAQVVAEAETADGKKLPYLVHSDNFWLIADSPFSYSGEDDRYLVFADALHDILHIDHPEKHLAMLRIEDLNSLSDPQQLKRFLSVLRRQNIPFSFGYVPVYVDPFERQVIHLSDRPDVVNMLHEFVKAGGVPVLHGYTHQHRGRSTDDYEFWDDIGNKPVRDDSFVWADHRIEDALSESFEAGLWPVTWETPHYAASHADYEAIHKHFNTVFERRQTENLLGSDQYFPYPVTDLRGQFVIPESLGYIPQTEPSSAAMLHAAEDELVVRDGYAVGFLHPFLKPQLLDEVISGIKKLGFEFVDLRTFPNRAEMYDAVITNLSGKYRIAGEGRYLTEKIIDASGHVRKSESLAVEPGTVERSVELMPGETYFAHRQNTREPTLLDRIWRLAKGDVTAIHKKLESIRPLQEKIEPNRAALVWNNSAKGPEAIDQKSFQAMMGNFGLDVEIVNLPSVSTGTISAYDFVVVPSASATKLSSSQIDVLRNAVEKGLILVTDGASDLAEALGFRIGSEIPVLHVYDRLIGERALRWPDRPTVPTISAASVEEDDVYYAEQKDHSPLVVKKEHGTGQAIFFAPLFDPISGRGYSRFPDFPYLLASDLGVRPVARRNGADVYFDPGYRQSVSIERLAKIWRRSGVRVIHAGAWHFYNKYAYDYDRLIRVAHQNGIQVYAWFEWPYISQVFWNKHPEWREKNALLADAKVDWRSLMALENPDCLKAALKDARSLLDKYEWDGIDVGELHYESVGPEDKARFTPFSQTSRSSFNRKHGYDPIEIFTDGSAHFWKSNPSSLRDFYDFRKAQVVTLMDKILEELKKTRPLAAKHGEIVVTTIDSFEHPELSDYLGLDISEIIRVINKHDATLQVEDPAVEWPKAPERYSKLKERYRKFKLRHPFMVDINVLPVHPEGQLGFASDQPTGAEILDLWRTASSDGTRVSLYSESSIFEQDWEILPYAMASEATVRKVGDEWLINSPSTMDLEVGTQKHWFLDGEPWPCFGRGVVVVPAGEHRLASRANGPRLIDTTELDLRLVGTTGNLISAEPRHHGINIEYQADRDSLMLFNKPPDQTILDGSGVKFAAWRGDDAYAVQVPAGHHKIWVSLGHPFAFFVQYASLVSASLIVLFGAASTSLLIILIVAIKLNRRARHLKMLILRQSRRSA